MFDFLMPLIIGIVLALIAVVLSIVYKLRKSVRKLTKKQVCLLSEEQYKAYYYSLRDRYEKSWINKLSLSTRERIHPLLLKIIKIRNHLNGYKLNIL